MKHKVYCTVCGVEVYKAVDGRYICLECSLKKEGYDEPHEKVSEEARVTMRNLNRIRRFNTILDILSEKLDLTDEHIIKVRRYMANLLHYIGGNSRINGYLFVAYSIWYVLRREGRPASLNNIILITNMVFNKRYRVRHVNRLLYNISHHTLDKELYIRLNVRDYLDYVFSRMSLEIDIEYKEISRIRDISIYINEMLDRGYKISNPRISAAVSIAMAVAISNIVDNSRSMDEMLRYIAGILDISHYTLRKRVREVIRGLGLINKCFTVYT